MKDWNDILRKTLELCDPHQLEFDTFSTFILRALAIRNSKICRPDNGADDYTKAVAYLKSQILAQIVHASMLSGNINDEYLVSSYLRMTTDKFIEIAKELITEDLEYVDFESLECFFVCTGEEFVYYLRFKFHLLL